MSQSLKRNLILDMETSDPDDLMNLFLLGGHPYVHLKAVTIVPGTPAQLLLIHEALNMMAQHAGSNPDLGYLRHIPLGYSDIDADVKNSDLAESEESLSENVSYDPYAFTKGRLYKSMFPNWDMVISSQTVNSNTGKRSKSKGSKSQGKGKNLDKCSSNINSSSDAHKAHEKLKAFILNKIQKERSSSESDCKSNSDPVALEAGAVEEGYKLLMHLCDQDTVLVTGGPLNNLGKAIRESEGMTTKAAASSASSSNGTEDHQVKSKSTSTSLREFSLGRWCAQGGFAGYNVLPGAMPEFDRGASATTPTLPRFKNDWHNPAWNFDQSYLDSILALSSDCIAERFVCSKNVCHQVLYDMELHSRVKQVVKTLDAVKNSVKEVVEERRISSMEEVQNNSDGQVRTSLDFSPKEEPITKQVLGKKRRWGKNQDDFVLPTSNESPQTQTADESTAVVDSVASDSKVEQQRSDQAQHSIAASRPITLDSSISRAKPSRSAPKTSSIPPPSSTLALFYRLMDTYSRADGKKLHDLVAGLCAIDPAMSGCGFRKAKLDFIKAQNPKYFDKHGKLTGGRWKNGGEWGCRYGVGKVEYFWKDGSNLDQSSCEEIDMPSNVWISVDVDLDRFRDCLVGSI
eukprot:TRINITY_DN96273_c0_g1_i1.p1 TRINITY_DN96273_c0_g1~~TRINITY_DN96273_c0_g1_i1.p1  ORF type:complete len:651 (+),score=82.83 TRINITY_DN96273_c0_g1_i1:69-1955(+)